MDELNDLKFSNALLHSGVKGMHWGKWNEETRRKYEGRVKKAAASLKAAGSSVKKAVGAASKTAEGVVSSYKDYKVKSDSERAAKLAEKAKLEASGFKDWNSYNKARVKALNSSRTKDLQKGMATLTDSEIASKTRRLKLETELMNAMHPLPKTRKQRVQEVLKNKAPGIVSTAVRGAVEQGLASVGFQKLGFSEETANKLGRWATGTYKVYKEDKKAQDKKAQNKKAQN